LNDAFQLRDCPQPQTMLFADEAELFPQSRSPGCLRHDIGTCLAPCAALCSSRRYESQVGRALAFLRGEDDRLLPRIEAAMKQAARDQAYERAAALKQQHDALHWLAQRLDRLRSAQAEHSFVYPVTDAAEQCHWYVIQRGFVHAVHPAPASADGRDALVAQLRDQFGGASNPGGSASIERIEEMLLVLAWFRRYPNERKRALSLGPEAAQVRL
jgi:excinuclease ABC subunit C